MTGENIVFKKAPKVFAKPSKIILDDFHFILVFTEKTAQKMTSYSRFSKKYATVNYWGYFYSTVVLFFVFPVKLLVDIKGSLAWYFSVR